MGVFLHLFETEEQFNEIYNGSGYTKPWVSYIKGVSKVRYNKKYLTFEIINSGQINIEIGNLEYKLNRNGCVTVPSGGISAQTGDVIKFRAPIDNPNASVDGCFSGSTCAFKVKGNIMSLLYGENFETKTELTTASCFANLFNNCTGLTDASELILPATTLANNSYSYMFSGCTSLTTAPELPAITLAHSCYGYMFQGCTSLETAPQLPATTLAIACYWSMFCGCSSLTTAPEELPATTLVENCYYQMFMGCSSLTTAPDLPATALTNSCYYQMFAGCTNLNYIKCLATDISASYCTYYWVNGVASSGTFVKNPNMSGWTTGISGIPSGWTVTNAS